MAETRDFGRLFFHTMKWPVPGGPLIERGHTQEIEEPYRTARPLLFRLPGKRRFVLGWWGPSVSESVAMRNALGGMYGELRDVPVDHFLPDVPDKVKYQIHDL